MSQHPPDLRDLFLRMAKRPYLQVLAAYVPLSLILIEAANNVLPTFDVSIFWNRLLIVALIGLLPIVVGIAWMLDEPDDAAEASAGEPAQREDAPPPGDAPVATSPRAKAWKLSPRRRRAAIGVPAVVLLSASFARVSHDVIDGRPAADPQVAVLAFEDHSPARDHAYLAVGLAEQIATALAGVDSLEVYEAADSASALVTGSVTRWQDRLRITAKLVRTSNQQRLWSRTFEAPVERLIAVQDSLAGAIAQELVPALREAETSKAAPGDVGTASGAAYAAYLEGRYHVRRAIRPAAGAEPSSAVRSARAAVDALEQAVRMDPGYRAAYVELSRAYDALVATGGIDLESGAARAAEAREAATELGPGGGLLGAAPGS